MIKSKHIKRKKANIIMRQTEMYDFSKTIITIITTVITLVVGGLIGYFSARRISRLNARNIAYAELRTAFAPAMAYIYLAKKRGSFDESSVPDVDKFLKDSLLEHAAAIEKSRVFVPKSKRTTFQDAWEKYRYEVARYGFDANNQRKDIDDPYNVFEALIHNILFFAQS